MGSIIILIVILNLITVEELSTIHPAMLSQGWILTEGSVTPFVTYLYETSLMSRFSHVVLMKTKNNTFFTF